MWALIEDGSITKLINNPKGMVIGDTQYSRKIFSHQIFVIKNCMKICQMQWLYMLIYENELSTILDM